ncbi:hypothetical protein TNCT_144471 [Trichonephila clavata]|uniref:Uncharacterized protein n=1 Tax=Trichonephila clavata TaxID=2740835 RepID=A0A8X6JMT5_TRICU|nr:hypothetical protein TNCT_144471 [Trichonephila clavata]
MRFDREDLLIEFLSSDKYAAMLLPLVESNISEEILRIWLRNPPVFTAEESYSQKLRQLSQFLRLEVEGEKKFCLQNLVLNQMILLEIKWSSVNEMEM